VVEVVEEHVCVVVDDVEDSGDSIEVLELLLFRRIVNSFSLLFYLM
jgi:hypoxanthine phosphoribosyltransferase